MPCGFSVIPATLGILGECGVERVGVAQHITRSLDELTNLSAQLGGLVVRVAFHARQAVEHVLRQAQLGTEAGVGKLAEAWPVVTPGSLSSGALATVCTWCGEAGHCLGEGLHHCSDGYREGLGDQLLFQQLTQALATILTAKQNSVCQPTCQLSADLIRPTLELLPIHGGHSLRHLGLGLHLEIGTLLGQNAQLSIEVVSAAVLGFPDFVISSCLSICTQALAGPNLVE